MIVLLIMAACRSTPEKTTVPPAAPPVLVPTQQPTPPAETPPAVTPTPPSAGTQLRRGNWTELPGWRDDDPAAAWDALLTSCGSLKTQEAWRAVCTAALATPRPDRERARRFFELNFIPYQLLQADGGVEGLATGYYEPLLRGSRKPTTRYRYPIYGAPDDLISVDLPAFGIESRESRLRARLDAEL